MLLLTLKNPYITDVIETTAITLEDWKGFLEAKEHGNREVISFHADNTNRFVTINPVNFASIEAEEVENA